MLPSKSLFGTRTSQVVLHLGVAAPFTTVGILIASHLDLFAILAGFVSVLGVLILAVQSLEFSLATLLLCFVLVDPVRRMISYTTGTWSFTGLLAIDFALMITIVSLYRLHRAKSKETGRSFLRYLFTHVLDKPFQFLLLVYLFWVVLEIFNPRYPIFVLMLAAIREYVLAIPVIGIGSYIGGHWRTQNWRHAYRFISVVVLGLVALSLIQLVVKPEHVAGVVESLLVPAEHAVHSHGDEPIQLTSSVFASSKRYGRFLLMVYPLLWACLKERKRRHEWVISLVIAVGCFVSGSREAVFLLLLSMLALSEQPTRLFGRGVVLAIGMGLILYWLMGASFVTQRLSFTPSSPADWLNRFRYMTLYPVIRELGSTLNASYIWGLGASRAGQATQLLGPSAAALDPLVAEDVLSTGVADAGLLKILLDLGFVGLFLFLLLQSYILRKAWPWQRQVREDPYALASGVAIVVWLVLFAKAHSVMSDQMMNVFFWFYVGLLFSRRRKDSYLSICKPRRP